MDLTNSDIALGAGSIAIALVGLAYFAIASRRFDRRYVRKPSDRTN